MSNSLQPAFDIIKLLGGVRATARIVNLSPGAVSRWTVSADRRGTAGRIPQRHWHTILQHAKKQRIKLTLKDLARIV